MPASVHEVQGLPSRPGLLPGGVPQPLRPLEVSQSEQSALSFTGAAHCQAEDSIK